MKKFYPIFYLLTSIIAVIFLTYCSAKSTVRYDEKNNTKLEQKEAVKDKNEINYEENFDISPFRTEIKLPEKKVDFNKSNNEIWYQYDVKENSSTKNKKIIGTANGFRVQVVATDDLDEATRIQEELKAIKGANEIYSVFEPPFYKVLIGDFKSSDEANSLKFKLSQLGYSDSKVIKSTINLFE
ncbi:MAG: SPOR domain-containing protein [Ignavibacterium sp.]|uniref:SPOR domain-containing protein n=1 Tax=Ignavibacterium sp. TaxID=2651167 RepID=UPI00404B50E7